MATGDRWPMRERWIAAATAPLSLSRLVALTGERVYRPMYHTVRGAQPLPHIEALYAPHPLERFERDVDELLALFDPVALDELPAALAEPRRGGRPRVFFSFDDGLREVVELAMPVLRARGVRATVFVNSAFVDNADLFYRYLASALVERMSAQPPSAETRAAIHRALGSEGSDPDGEAPERSLRSACLGIGHGERARLHSVAELLGFDVAAFLQHQRPYADTGQLRQLQSEGWTIGAHSVDHPLYRQLPLAEQLRQSDESRAFVERTFKTAAVPFAFPFSDAGVGAAYFDRFDGMRNGALQFGGQGYRDERWPWMVQRHSMEGREGSLERCLRADHGKAMLRRLTRRYRVRRG